jgi:hypothetical protein
MGYGLRGRGELFHVGWCFVANGRMKAVSIVEGFEEAEEGGSQQSNLTDPDSALIAVPMRTNTAKPITPRPSSVPQHSG